MRNVDRNDVSADPNARQCAELLRAAGYQLFANVRVRNSVWDFAYFDHSGAVGVVRCGEGVKPKDQGELATLCGDPFIHHITLIMEDQICQGDQSIDIWSLEAFAAQLNGAATQQKLSAS